MLIVALPDGRPCSSAGGGGRRAGASRIDLQPLGKDMSRLLVASC
jgi:hypothetical protein